MLQDVSLHDRYDLGKRQVLLNGTQALVRLMLMQRARDAAAGLDTAGYVTGYRGSPLGAVDMQMTLAAERLGADNILFQPGLNEDLAATAIWGSQQAELRGQGKHQGVFGLWYGKGPGVDRSGDVMRHANFAGTAPMGGVLMAMGDDHTGESSTTLHQSDWAMVDAYMPVLSPAGVQEILDFGLYGYALSRFAGVWVGLKTMKDTVEVTSVVDGDPHRATFITPDFPMPEGGLNIRLIDTPQLQEARMIDHKRHAVEAFGRANRLDRRVWGKPGAKIGFVAAGKNWLDLTHALSLLGLDADEAARLGITTYKIGMTWPLDMTSFREFAEGLDLIVVVEEKRKLIEVQVKEAIFDNRQGRRVFGATDDRGRELFTTKSALDPIGIAQKIGGILIDEGRGTDHIKNALERIEESTKSDNAPEIAARTPWFCSGCPHNSSTKVPEGARAYAGIGCHYMVQWMDRETTGFTQMGGEGANWIGEAPFSTTPHVFQNLGDGTYNHSGLQAIRAAIAAGTTMTYKILYNDAVAMTGGQGNDGGLSAYQIAAEVHAMGIADLVVVHDEKEPVEAARLPAGVPVHPRAELQTVQERLAKVSGVSVLLYIQTCAAEKRRRRKRGTFPDPDRRVMINPDVCEGCGDCGVQSNCVSITPLDTPLGRKRAIDQSSCNKDFSCINGFCPSFVTVEGGTPRKSATRVAEVPDLPEPVLPNINGTWNVVVTGVGGTGVVTIGAVLAMAAHIDGKGAGMMEMAGLAQKGGAVHIHCRLANTPADISAIRVAVGECDALIGGDLVVSAGAKTLGLMEQGRAGAVVNSHEIVTGVFTQNRDFTLPADRLRLSLEARLGDKVAFFDASEAARLLLGDAIFSNMLVFGAAWQRGLIPLSLDAIRRAVELNGAAVARNLKAFDLGRWSIVDADGFAKALEADANSANQAMSPEEVRKEALRAYQGNGMLKRYMNITSQISDNQLKDIVSQSYFKLLTYKDEYEVARLLMASRAQAEATFEGDLKLSYHLAPPLLSREGTDGRPKKRAFGAWLERFLPLLSKAKVLRGTPFDPFGYTAERRAERALIVQFEHDLDAVLPLLGDATRTDILELLALPMDIRGFGPVKAQAMARAATRRAELLENIQADGTPTQIAAE